MTANIHKVGALMRNQISFLERPSPVSEYLYFWRPLQRFGSCCVPATVVFVTSKFFFDLFSNLCLSSHMRMDDEGAFSEK